MTRRSAVVVGGGLAGLVAAVLLARKGLEVRLLERARAVGGRAASEVRDGFVLNQGAHALYVGGAGRRTLREIGVELRGGQPAPGGYLLTRGALHLLPGTPWSALASRALSVGGKVELGRTVKAVLRADPETLEDVTTAEFLARTITRADALGVAEALVRVSTYGGEPRAMSAAVAVSQLAMAVRHNVDYLDGGWQSIVDGLRGAAASAGVVLQTDARAAEVVHEARVRGVRLEDGTGLSADVVILAVPPAVASKLVDRGANPTLAAHARTARPVRVATLDLALRALPCRKRTLVLGTDAPLYLSVHSATAALAPEGGAVLHAMKYLGTGETAPDEDRAEIEALLDLTQPGWREAVVFERWRPKMTVHHDLPTASRGGFRGRPDVRVPGIGGLFVAGDWVGAEGLLADAAIASARRAAMLASEEAVSSRAA